MTTTLHPHSELIDALGGTTKTARDVGKIAHTVLRSQTVTVWRTRGIAYDWRPSVAELARRMNIAVPLDFLLPRVRPRRPTPTGEAYV